MKKKLIIIISIVVVLIMFLTLMFVSLFNAIKLDKEIEVGISEEYKEPGYSAHFLMFNLTNKVKQKGEVNTDKMGTYHITYYIDFKLFKVKKIRTVIVRDKIAPTITLKGEENAFVCPGKEYKEDGYEALDNIDGDLTDKVDVNNLKEEIVYSVKDSSGNKTEVRRKITVGDTEGPKLTLKGNSNTYVNVGTSYSEAGYNVSDNCDTKVDVKVSGYVNASKLGTYELTYIAKDSSGNETTVKRKVNVVKMEQKGTIYLTFDDGPSSITPKILDILKEENVKATFFVIHSGLNKYIKREYDEGHTVALHSYTHNYKTIYASETAYFNDLDKIRNEVNGIIGIKPNIIRFPGGSSNTVSRFNKGIMTRLTKQVEDKGYAYFDWNVSSGDAGETNSKDGIYKNVTSRLLKGSSVVLMHDKEGNYGTLNALRDIIKYGKANGYTFDKLTESTRPIHHGVNN